MRSHKEQSIDAKLIEMAESFHYSEKVMKGIKLLLEDEELQAVQEYANTVSIVRLGYNDHGPVHMRSVALNAIVMANLLRQAGIKTNLEKEDCGDLKTASWQ